MNLQNQYKKVKNKSSIVNIIDKIGGFIVGLGIAYVVNLIWNYVAPVWGLPVLTYIQFLATLFLVQLFKQYLSLASTKNNNTVNYLTLDGGSFSEGGK